MNISDLELFRIELPCGGCAVRSLLVRIVADRGFEGWGETRKPWRIGELAARRKALLAVLAGREVCDVESILALDALADPALACGVEMALWDLIARSVKLPLFHLMGGGYRRSVPMSVRLPEGAPELVAEWARAFSAQAVASQIISGTGSATSDLKLATAAREACPDRVQFRFDAQGRYDLREAAALVPDSIPIAFNSCSIRWVRA